MPDITHSLTRAEGAAGLNVNAHKLKLQDNTAYRAAHRNPLQPDPSCTSCKQVTSCRPAWADLCEAPGASAVLLHTQLLNPSGRPVDSHYLTCHTCAPAHGANISVHSLRCITTPLTSNSWGATTAATAHGSCKGAPLWNLNTSLNRHQSTGQVCTCTRKTPVDDVIYQESLVRGHANSQSAVFSADQHTVAAQTGPACAAKSHPLVTGCSARDWE
jgi:hypothetical protein